MIFNQLYPILVQFSDYYLRKSKRGKIGKVRKNKTIYGVWWSRRSTATVLSAKSNSQARAIGKTRYKKGYGKITKVALLNDRDAEIAKRGDWVRTRADGLSASESKKKTRYRPWLVDN